MTDEARIRANQIAKALDTVNTKLSNIDTDVVPKEVRVSGARIGIVTYEDEDLARVVKTIIKMALFRDKEKLEKEMEAL